MVLGRLKFCDRSPSTAVKMIVEKRAKRTLQESLYPAARE